jgi:hypothetical protein
MKLINVYETFDNKLFRSKLLAEEHERFQLEKAKKLLLNAKFNLKELTKLAHDSKKILHTAKWVLCDNQWVASNYYFPQHILQFKLSAIKRNINRFSIMRSQAINNINNILNFNDID